MQRNLKRKKSTYVNHFWQNNWVSAAIYFSLCPLPSLFLLPAPDCNADEFGAICADIVTVSKLCDFR